MIPGAVLTRQITIEPYLGVSSMEPTWGPPTQMSAWVEHVVPRRIYLPDGSMMHANTFAIVRADASVSLFSRVSYEGLKYEVVLILPEEGILEAEALDLWLRQLDS